MSHRLHRLNGLILAAMAMAAPLWATTVKRMDLPELVAAADSIVQGRVQSVDVKWEKNLAFTYIAVDVDDPLKGERRRSVVIRQLGGKVVRQLGGKVGWLHVTVSGMPQFEEGRQVIVFLKAQQGGTYEVVGLNQGKYEIVDDFAVANVYGLTLADSKTGQLTDAGFKQKAPLEAFKAKIKELVR